LPYLTSFEQIVSQYNDFVKTVVTVVC